MLHSAASAAEVFCTAEEDSNTFLQLCEKVENSDLSGSGM